jgi:hypothetical protein
VKKTAIAVYNPSDPLERAVQNAYHEQSVGWLDMYSCKVFTKALISLKMFDEDWLNHHELFEHRVRYFFAPHMSMKKDFVVFPTTLLFLRDILENCSINGFIINPVAFVTRPISHYLLREYSIHILIDKHKMLAVNSGKEYLDVGGLVIFDEHNVTITEDSIIDIVTKDTGKGKSHSSVIDVEHMTEDMGYQKVAVSLRGPGVFTNDEHKRAIKPQSAVWDKIDRKEGTVITVEPGENGIIEVLLDDGIKKIISQVNFDREFVLV